MKGKCACLADFFLLQKKEGDYSRLIRENKIIGIACRVAASSNEVFHRIAYAPGELCDGAKINMMSLPTITTKQWAVTNKKKWGVRPIAWR
jgi:hypothetical protein